MKKTSVKPLQKNILLFVDKLYGHMIDAVRKYEKETQTQFRIGLFLDSKSKVDHATHQHLNKLDVVISCDTHSPTAIQKSLLPFQDQIAAITCRSDASIPMFQRIIPHLPYLHTPTTESLNWASQKELMRDRLVAFDKSITPTYLVINSINPTTLNLVEEKIGFPVIVKPSGLGASRLVSVCYHKDELANVLKKIGKKIEAVYKETDGRGEPKILVEEFMEGKMYSIDGYVDATGHTSFTPMAVVKTGYTIGFDDFFGYQQLTPTLLKKDTIELAEIVAHKTVQAIGLRNTTVHIELMRTEQGWKVIEIGPRMGGFRHMIYEEAFGFNHVMNDLLNRLGKKPIIKKNIIGHAVAMKFFAKKEGRLVAINGIKKIKELASFRKIYVHKKAGDTCTYAKHGGSSVFDIILKNKNRSDLLADIRRLEQCIDIVTE